jgi:hypothetical protein
MRELHLWRLLRDRIFDPAEIIPLLKELAGRPLAQRMPFLGLLPSALEHADPAVRAAAVPVLAGARGRLALHQAIAALHDNDQAVRLAAVDALHECVRGDDTARWAHVMFHSDPDIRAAGLAKEFPAPYLYRLFLIADPVHGEAVRRSFEEQPLPDNVIPQILDYHKRGTIDGVLGRRLASRLDWQAWHRFFDSFYPRHDNFDALLERTRLPNWPEVMSPEYHPDQLDDVLHLFWEEDPNPNGGPSGSERFFRMLQTARRSRRTSISGWRTRCSASRLAARTSRSALEACRLPSRHAGSFPGYRSTSAAGRFTPVSLRPTLQAAAQPSRSSRPLSRANCAAIQPAATTLEPLAGCCAPGGGRTRTSSTGSASSGWWISPANVARFLRCSA